MVTVGFCFGGSHSWRQSGGTLDLAGCAGFYGKPSVVGDAATRAHLPTVMLIAGADRATPVEDQLRLAETMRTAGADVDAVVYDGAPHSFFDRAFAEWEGACRDAWRRAGAHRPGGPRMTIRWVAAPAFVPRSRPTCPH